MFGLLPIQYFQEYAWGAGVWLHDEHLGGMLKALDSIPSIERKEEGEGEEETLFKNL